MNHISIKQTATFAKRFELKYTIEEKYFRIKDNCYYIGKYSGPAYST